MYIKMQTKFWDYPAKVAAFSMTSTLSALRAAPTFLKYLLLLVAHCLFLDLGKVDAGINNQLEI